MKTIDYISLKKGAGIISNEVGILSHISKLPRLNDDPKLVSYGVWPCNTKLLGGAKYSGRSSGCGPDWVNSMLGTIGETVERYCASFYNTDEMITSSYARLQQKAIHPGEFALFHPKQYDNINFPFEPFTEDSETTWVPCKDLTTGEDCLYPGEMIYIPWIKDEEWYSMTSSTGLAAHTNLYKAILTGLYETIERDAFVLTWTQHLAVPKLVITPDIQAYIDRRFPPHYEFHFMDISLDIGVPSVFGICFGQAEYGNFVAVGTATRGTYKEALEKVVMEIGQAVPYFRYLLEKRKGWNPTSFNELMSFEDHSIFYIKKPELWDVYLPWTEKTAEKTIDFKEKDPRTDEEKIRSILSALRDRGCNVLLKNITTPDVRQVGFHSIKVMVPQLLQMAGSYPFYFLGGKRLYEVPTRLGYKANSYDHLNKFPHPFP